MLHTRREIAALTVLLLLPLLAGCGGQGNPPANKGAPPTVPQTGQEQRPPKPRDNGGAPRPRPRPQIEAPPPPAAIPKVNLTETLRATCVVGVGDRLPEASLPDLQGKPVPLDTLLGPKATIVLLFNLGETEFTKTQAVNALNDFGHEFLEPYGAKGVAVVAIDVGDPPAAVAPLAQQVQPKYPLLLDAKGEFFAKLAKQRLPRVYLLDAAGKILWFDIEYSRTTRRDVRQSILAVLESGNAPAAKPNP